MAYTVPWQLMGIGLAGDVGGFSTYTDRYGKKIVYPFSPPKEPPSPEQIVQRASFKTAQAAWSALTKQQKQTLEEACRKTSIPLTGQNLYMSAILRKDPESYTTIEKQSGLILPALP